MAYNVLKGTVEGSVDQHADQEIEGNKTFKNIIRAKTFYDMDADSPCETLKDVAVNKIENSTQHGIVTFKEDGTLRVEPALTFRDNVLQVREIEASHFKGSGSELTNLQASNINGTIDAKIVGHSARLHNVRGELQVKCGEGLSIEGGDVSVSTSPTGALTLRSGALVVDPSKTLAITEGGQNLSDNDVLLVGDVSLNSPRNTTLKNFYENYIKVKMPQAAGSINQIQLKGSTGFASSAKLSYDTNRHILNVDGQIAALSLEVGSALRCRGAITANIETISQEKYNVKQEDYTILCNSVKTPITVVLPPACNNPGRILNIKKANENKYHLRSFPVTIEASEGFIDLRSDIVMKMNYSSRTLQSDGKNWWVIGTKGS